MSLLNAMNDAVSGLSAQATALAGISNNIANSSTVGYKQTDTDFDSMVLAGSGPSAGADNLAGVTAQSRMDISVAGQVQTTGVNTDLAVNGAGMMIVRTQAAAGQGQYLATRAGSFRPDAAGNLVNAGGYYLQGVPLDAAGNPLAGGSSQSVQSLSTVNVAGLSAAAVPTTSITFDANLPAADTTGVTAAAPFTGTAPSSSETYYDALGNAQTLTLTFTPTGANQWQLNVTDSATPTAAGAAGVVASAALAFNATGTNAGALSSVTGTGYNPATGVLTVPTGAGTGSIALDIGKPNGSSGLTQLAGNYTVTNVANNGAAFGLLDGVSVNSSGQVLASFSNGSSRPIYQVPLAIFANEDGLSPTSGDAYQMTPDAGMPQLFDPGQGPAGSMQGGALEGSNVDLPTQLTNLIETQRAYSSVATVIQTTNQMMDTVNHLNQ